MSNLIVTTLAIRRNYNKNVCTIVQKNSNIVLPKLVSNNCFYTVSMLKYICMSMRVAQLLSTL